MSQSASSPTQRLIDERFRTEDSKIEQLQKAEKPSNYYLMYGVVSAGTAAFLVYQAYTKREWYEGLTTPTWAPSSLILHMALRIINYGILVWTANSILMRIDAEDRGKRSDEKRGMLKVLIQVTTLAAIALDLVFAYFFFSKGSFGISFLVAFSQFLLQALFAGICYKVESGPHSEKLKGPSYMNTILATLAAGYSLCWAIWLYAVKSENKA